MSAFAIDVLDETRGVVIQVQGGMDIAANDMLQRTLMGVQVRRPSRVVLDLSGATFISSLCIGSLVTFRRGVVMNGGSVTIASPSALVLDSLRRVGLDKIFPMTQTVDAGFATA